MQAALGGKIIPEDILLPNHRSLDTMGRELCDRVAPKDLRGLGSKYPWGHPNQQIVDAP